MKVITKHYVYWFLFIYISNYSNKVLWNSGTGLDKRQCYASEIPWHGIFSDLGGESLYNYYNSVFSKAL